MARCSTKAASECAAKKALASLLREHKKSLWAELGHILYSFVSSPYLIVNTFVIKCRNVVRKKKMYSSTFLAFIFYDCQLIIHFLAACINCRNYLFIIICSFCWLQTDLGHFCKLVLFGNPCLCIHDIALLICYGSNLGLFTLQHTWHFTLLVCGLWGIIGRLISVCFNDSNWCANVILHVDARYPMKLIEQTFIISNCWLNKLKFISTECWLDTAKKIIIFNWQTKYMI